LQENLCLFLQKELLDKLSQQLPTPRTCPFWLNNEAFDGRIKLLESSSTSTAKDSYFSLS
jgi:hypothetical protein